jgi:hypothetical protein
MQWDGIWCGGRRTEYTYATALKLCGINPFVSAVRDEAGLLNRLLNWAGAGLWEYSSLAPGTYRLEVESAGYNKFSRQPIEIQVQTATRVDVTLQVGDVKQTIDVVTESPLLQT